MNTAEDRSVWEFRTALSIVTDLAEHTADLPDLAQLLCEVRQAKRELGDVERLLERTIGERMPGKNLTIEGVGVLERHRDRSWRNWEHDNLLRMVLDVDRRPKAEVAGAVESDLDVLRHVYGLKGYNASRTALKERGIDPEEFAEYEDRGWKVQVR